jgi:predicted ABC-type ATPase
MHHHCRTERSRKDHFAREFLAKEAGVVHFVNPDLIASGLSPLRPELAAFAAGRLFLQELDRLADVGTDFAFESTLSGLGYLSRLKRWKAAGRRIEIVYLRISSPQLALRRIATPVGSQYYWKDRHEAKSQTTNQ